jgi:hypothetical protein
MEETAKDWRREGEDREKGEGEERKESRTKTSDRVTKP